MIKFDFYYSIPFWAAFVLILFVTRLIFRSPKSRPYLLLILSSVMILAVPQISPLLFIAILGITTCSYLIGRFVSRRSPAQRPSCRNAVAVAGVLTVLAFLAFFKYHLIQDLFIRRRSAPGQTAPHFIFLIGVSYFSFKMIHFIVEAWRGKIENPRLLYYLNFILFFPSFISGPINRFPHFASQIRNPSPTPLSADLKMGGERIVHGLFKKFVLVQLLYPHILGQHLKPLAALSPGDLAVGLYAYALYFYFDFAGYSDLAIGSARILGIELPENFNNPFLKKNIRELWMNWHMSLTGWLVEYIYWPLVRKSRSLNYFRTHPVALSNAGMIITFIACGMWHGETISFVIWGLYHGLGISFVNVYQRQKRTITSPLLQSYFRSRTSAMLGTLATFHFFTIGLLFFAYDFNSIRLFFLHLLSKI
jgi:alginate O-acetyltransferase complex protein AlgI